MEISEISVKNLDFLINRIDSIKYLKKRLEDYFIREKKEYIPNRIGTVISLVFFWWLILFFSRNNRSYDLNKVLKNVEDIYVNTHSLEQFIEKKFKIYLVNTYGTVCCDSCKKSHIKILAKRN